MGFAEELVAGPRGRRLCCSVVMARERAQSGADVARAARSADPDSLARWEVSDFLGPLADAVDSAMYWQEPDEVDSALADPQVADALLPTARAVAEAPANRWWFEPVDPDRQFHVEFEHTGPPLPGNSGAELASWREATAEDERRAEHRPPDPSAPYSGIWWSSPPGSLLTTTRALPGLGPLGLCLEEDSFGPEQAWCRAARPVRPPEIYEITGPGAWAELAARYPFEVSLSRRHDWWKVSGWEGRWLLPDWAAVAADYDAVHLTAAGYLTTAGRALRVEHDTCTMLAGWDPDQSFWLTDSLALDPPTPWRGDAGDLTTWSPA